MRLLIISGSQRTGSQSARVAQYITGVSQSFSEVNHLELYRYNLPFWDGTADSKTGPENPWTMIREKVSDADALILITPEWDGMASPILKNFLLMCDHQDTAHKPALLVSVVAGINGAYPIAELRSNAFKNNKLVPVPDHLIIRNAADVLENTEHSLHDRIAYSVHTLHQYSVALKGIRMHRESEPFPNQQDYAYGM